MIVAERRKRRGWPWAAGPCLACVLFLLIVANALGAFSQGRETLHFSASSSATDALSLPGSGILLLGSFSDGPESGLVKLRRNGSIDRSFAQGGILDANYSAAAVDGLGRILLVSTEQTSIESWDVAVTRIRYDGTVDRSFGADGTATVDLGRRIDSGTAIRVQPNGKILVGGLSANVAEDRGSNDGIPVVARLLGNGRLDRSFGQGGREPLDGGLPAVQHEPIQSFAFGPRHTILAALGERSQLLIARLRPDGAIDRSFGSDGLIAAGGLDPLPGLSFVSMIPKLGVLPSGDIVLAGTASPSGQSETTSYSLIVLRYRADGTPDRSFGDGGSSVVNFSGEAFASAFALQRSGRVVVAGSMHPDSRRSVLALASLRPDGGVYRRFGHGGRATIGFRSANLAVGLVLQRPGRAVVVGLAQDVEPPFRANGTVLARVPLSRHGVR